MKGANSSSSNNATNGRASYGGGGRGGKQQQQMQNQQNPATSSSSSSYSHQPKPNAWSKPLQATGATNKSVTAPPPGLGGTVTTSSSSSNARSENTGASSSRFSSTGPRTNSSQSNGSSNSHHAGSTNGSNANSNAFNNNSSFATELALRERFIHVVTVLTGQKVTITLKSGTVVSGVLHTATPFPHLPSSQRNKYVLKAVSIDKEGSPNSSIQPGETLILDMDSVVHLHMKSIRMDQLVANSASSNSGGTGDDFVTDTDISKTAPIKSSGPRELVQAGSVWTSGGKDILLSATSPNNSTVNSNRSFARSSSADDIPINSRAAKLAGASSIGTAPNSGNSTGAVLSGSIAGWDQFKANEELFNVTGGYDESVYTTTLDKSSLEADKIAHAEKLAREIESTVTYNPHLAEERGQIPQTEDNNEDELDEEDRYSGVLSADKITSKRSIPSKPQEGKLRTSTASDEISSKLSTVTLQETRQTSLATKPKLNYAQAVSSAKQVATNTASIKKAPSVPPPGFITEKSSTSAPSTAQPKKEVQDLESSPLFSKSAKPQIKKEAIAKEEPSLPVEEKDASKLEKAENESNEGIAKEPHDVLAKSASLEIIVNETIDLIPEANLTTTAEVNELDLETKANAATTSDEEKEQQEEAASLAASAKSKLNANAKEFTLNVGAKPFTPPSSMMQPQGQSQQLPPPPMPMQPQHMQQHHQFQPQFFDPNTGMPIPMHALPQYGAGAHMQPHHGQIPGGHHMMGPHHMMGTSQPLHYPGQYHVMRGYPGQYMDPHAMQQSQQPPTMQQIPPPPVPPTVQNTAPSSSSSTIPTPNSGANTPVVPDDGSETQVQPSQPQDSLEPQSTVPQPPQTMPQHVAQMQWQQQQPGYYGAPMHLPHQAQQHQRMGGPAPYPPQQFMHHSQMAAMQQMRQHHIYAPIVGAGGVAPPPSQMRAGATGGGAAGGGPLNNAGGSAGAIPFVPQPHNHMPGQYQPYNAHGGGVVASGGVISGGGGVGNGNTGYGDDDGQGGFGGRGLGGRGGRVGRGGRARGRIGRGRIGGRFNNQPYQPPSQSSMVGGGGGGSHPGSERQTPQPNSNPTSEGDGEVKVVVAEISPGSDFGSVNATTNVGANGLQDAEME